MSTNGIVPSSGTVARHAPRMTAVLAMAALMTFMAGCGVTRPQSDASIVAPTATAQPTVAAHPVPTPPVSATATSPTGTADSAACPTSTLSPGDPALILTPTTPARSGSAHANDLVQVRLPTTSKWSYQPAQTNLALDMVQPSGVLIQALDACVWTFRATGSGTETLDFTGQPICQPRQPCPNYRVDMSFNVTIS